MKKYNVAYDTKYLLQCLGWLIGLTLCMKATGGAAYVVAGVLMLFALVTGKSEKLFFWLLLSVAMVSANQNFVPKNFLFVVLQRSVMMMLGLMMTVRVFGGKRHKAVSIFFMMFAYALYMILPSAMGWSPTISFLKLILFVVMYFAYLGVAKNVGLGPSESGRRIRSAVLSFAIYFIVGSIILIPFPALSTLTAQEAQNNLFGSSLFKGMTTHSQCLGPMIASLSVMLLADLLFSVRKFDKLYTILLLCCPILMYKTSSRTGMGSYLFCSMVVFYYFIKARGIAHKWRRRAINAIMAVLSLVVVFGAFTPGVIDGVKSFIIKGDSERVEVTTENILATRQAKIDETLYNFKKKPLLGNGFQVSEYMQNQRYDSIASVLTAPIEKGFWISAVLEEGGVIGLSLLSLFFLVTFFTLIRCTAYVSACCLLVVIMTNLGEFSMFSMSYTGGIVWSMVFAGLVLDLQRIRAATEARQMGGFSW